MGPCPDTCGWRRTCPPKAPDAPPARRSASLVRGVPRRRSCSALSLLAATRPEAPPMPFAKKGAAGLTERLDVRVAPAEKARLRGMAAVAGVPVAELVRARALGRPVVPRTDATTIRELRRLGGLLKKVHLDSGGAYQRRRPPPPSPTCAPPSPVSRPATEARRDCQEGAASKLARAQEPRRECPRPGRLHRRSRARAATARRSSTAAGSTSSPIDHDGQVQEMIDLAEVARRDAKPVQHWILSWREGEQPTRRSGRRGGQDVPRRDGPGRPPGHLRASQRHPQLAPPPRRQPRASRVGEARHRQQGLRPQGRPPRHRQDRAAPGLGARGAGRSTRPTSTARSSSSSAARAERQPSARAMAFEERVGARSAERIAIEEAAPIIRRAGSWRELHEALAQGRDAVREEGLGRAPLDRRPAGQGQRRRPRLLHVRAPKRLGDFEPAPAPALPPPSRRPPRPDRSTRRRPCWRPTWSSAASTTKSAPSRESAWTASATNGASSPTGIGRSAPTSSAARGRGRATPSTPCAASPPRARRRRRPTSATARSSNERPWRRDRERFPSYEEWLARFDRDAADKWRHRTRRPATIEGSTVRPADPARHPRGDRRAGRRQSPLPPARLPQVARLHRSRQDHRHPRRPQPRSRPGRASVERAEVGRVLDPRRRAVQANLRRAGRRARLQDHQSGAPAGHRRRARATPNHQRPTPDRLPTAARSR